MPGTTRDERKEQEEEEAAVEEHIAMWLALPRSRVRLPFSIQTAQLIDQFTNSRKYRRCNLYRIPSISQPIRSRSATVRIGSDS